MSVVIPTLGRDAVLIDTLHRVLELTPPADEVIVVDQTPRHAPECESRLRAWDDERRIRWLRLTPPSIPRAMNRGLLEARGDVVLFMDDDVIPAPTLVAAHQRAHATARAALVAGRVLQPWHVDGSRPRTGFAGETAGEASEFIGCNFSIRRSTALEIGGFDERFVGAAYCYEAELSARLRAAGEHLWFEPDASLEHLRAASGGTRAHGDHLRTARPAHSVGAYYFLMRSRPSGWFGQMMARPFRSVATRHHLRRPWWILPSLAAELGGLVWALAMVWRGPRLLSG